MRFYHLSIVAALIFGIIFWLTYDYNQIRGIGALETENGFILHVEKTIRRNIFAPIERGSEFYRFDPKDGKYIELDNHPESTVAFFQISGKIYSVHPSYYSAYTFEDGKLTETVSKYFSSDPEGMQDFVCEFAVLHGEEIWCFAKTQSEKGSRIVKAVISGDMLSEPQLVKEAEQNIGFLEVSQNEFRTLMVWNDVEDPSQIYYSLSDKESSVGGSTTNPVYNGWGGFIPYFNDTEPGLLLLSVKDNSFDFFSFKENKVSRENLLSISGFDGKLTAFVLNGDSGFIADGSNVMYFENKGNKLTVSGEPAKLGNATFSPEAVQIVTQIVLILFLLVFSLLYSVKSKRYSKPFSIIHPSSLLVRSSAFIIDSMAVSALSFIMFFFYLKIQGLSFSILMPSPAQLIILQNLGTVNMILYGTIFETLFLATPGKLVFRMVVVSTRTVKPRFVSVLARNLMKPVDIFLSMILVTPFLMMFSPLNQRLGDMLSSTIIVDGRQKDVEKFADQAVFKVVTSAQGTQSSEEEPDNDE